jgi:hypothetical protein
MKPVTTYRLWLCFYVVTLILSSGVIVWALSNL